MHFFFSTISTIAVRCIGPVAPVFGRKRDFIFKHADLHDGRKNKTFDRAGGDGGLEP